MTLAQIAQWKELLRRADAPADHFASYCGKPRAEMAMLKEVRPHLAELLVLAETALHTQAILAMPIDRRARLRKLRMQYSPTRGKVPT